MNVMKFSLGLSSLFLVASCMSTTNSTLPTKIAFGSCGSQDKPMPILHKVVEEKPDVFIYLGDNIYGDTKDMKVLQAKYDKLGNKSEFKALKANVPRILATWDDHDYGQNDAGKEYPKKEESKEIFLNFWGEPEGTTRRETPGIYTSYMQESAGKKLQIIILDERTFRDPILRAPKKNKKVLAPWKNQYMPQPKAGSNFLGKKQWTWLEQEFKKPADLRIIASGSQFGHDYNGYESWTLFPFERERMFKLIAKTKANGVVFISGDVHWGEVSKVERDDTYPIYDITSSGINKSWKSFEPNTSRVGKIMRENHFGQIEIDWNAKDPQLNFSIIGLDGEKVVDHQVELSEISF